jgi:hypothetical protein
MSLDNIPVKSTIEIETVKLDENTFSEIKNLNQTLNSFVTEFGNLYLRKKDLMEESRRIDEITIKLEEEFINIMLHIFL